MGQEQLQPREHEGGGGPPCDDLGMTTWTEVIDDKRGPPSLTGRGEGQHGPDHQVHQGAFTGEEGGVPTQPLIWWKPQRKEGKTTGPTGQVKDKEERSGDHNTVREGEPSSEETNQPADEKGTHTDIITTL